jgi:hypothetical protein
MRVDERRLELLDRAGASRVNNRASAASDGESRGNSRAVSAPACVVLFIGDLH